MRIVSIILLSLVACSSYAQERISQLPNAGTLTGVEQIPAVQGGVTTKTTPAAITSYVATVLPTLAAGVYTPTLTNATNVASSTAFNAQYSRVGNVVTVSGRVDVTPTAGAGAITLLGISLPLASTITSDGEINGSGNGSESGINVDTPAIIYGDIGVGNNRALLEFNPASTTVRRFRFTFQYTVQ